MINIVIINDFAHINGGGAQIALTSGISLAQKGYSVTMFCAVGPVMAELQRQPNLHVEYLNQNEILLEPNRIRAFGQGIWNFKAQNMMRELLKKLDPAKTIIHLHGWSKALSSSVIHEAITRNFEVVCTTHDFFLACPNGLFYNYSQDAICHLQPLSTKCIFTNCDSRSYKHKIWRCARSFIERHIGYLPNRVMNYILPSELCHEVLSPFLPKKARLYRVDNPIDIPKLPFISVANNESFIAIGRLSKEKGFDLFAHAVKELGIKGVIVGDGYFRNTLLNIAPTLTITGWLTREKVIENLRLARALVFPSRTYETFALVVLEALSLGVPVIVPNTSVARRYVIDGFNGFVFKQGNLEDLKEKIGQLQDDNYVNCLGQNAYNKFWESPKTPDNYINNLEMVYSEILAKRSQK